MEIIIYFTLLCVIELIQGRPHLLQMLTGRTQQLDSTKECVEVGDIDVINEMNRVSSGQADNDMIILKNIRKVYPSTNGGKVAVRNQSFGIPKGECFGFPGVNGAGKTTTLQIFTGDVLPTSGTASLAGHDILLYPEQVRRIMGYCPQFDACVPSSQLDDIVSPLIIKLGLSQYADLPCGGYSGGNRRKLSVGIALIGDPQVVFLDEPSTGMDPSARRAMWDLICRTMTGKSVILTPHSMEECETLCHRVGIQVSGALRCIGSPQHLKDRFGSGFQLDVNIRDGMVSSLCHVIEAKFPGSYRFKTQWANLKFSIPKSMSLGEMFHIMERDCQSQGLTDSYSISDTTLEQIFIGFARQQSEEIGQVVGLEPIHQ